ncbi:ST3GAL3 [Branchiostoma lanceolatum]|uniref:ST3GAL3 protein n=1 Tax=Branchiostoma lanceolatum TaxID=7740 RepID=A0A8K0ENL4_BRALA|nr:ST3GAL3 [Branchiostoma lanceolatum]
MHVGKVKFLKLFLLVGGVWIFLHFCEETLRWYIKHEVKPRDTRALQSMVPTDAKTVHASIPDHKESALLTIEKVAKPLVKSLGDTINNRTGAYLQGSCIKGFVQKKFREFMPSFDRDMHMFITKAYREWGVLGNSSDELPFDFSREDLLRLDTLLNLLPNNGRPSIKSDSGCRRCLVLGSSGALLEKGLGQVIDAYDVVIRMNDAPVKGYQNDVGSRTDFRIFYPESSTLNQADLDTGAYYVVVMYKSNDLNWLQAILTKVKPTGQFWKWVAQKLDIDPAQFLILNPQVLRVAGREHVRLQGRWPTMGLIATTFALHYCDVVDLAGFGYGSSIFNHYYERDKTGGQPVGGTQHNAAAEKDYLIRLLDKGIISHDLTGVYKDNHNAT